ncbi:hypothetical protein BGX30_003868, partial [Mortierella sp. GBA39]
HHYDIMDSKKRNSNKNNNDDIGSQPVAPLVWFQKMLALGEEITMSGFVEAFGYTSEQDAHSAFSYPLSSSEIPRSVRTKLTGEYERWRRNEGAAYWASRAADYQIEVSTKKTVVDLVDRGQYFAGKLLRKRPRDKAKATPTRIPLPCSLASPSPMLASKRVSKIQETEDDNESEEFGLARDIGDKDKFDDDLDALLYDSPNEAEATSASISPTPTSSSTSPLCSKTKLRRRQQRFQALDRARFWKLQSGRAVEDVLFSASLKEDAPVTARIYKKDPSPFVVDNLSEAFWARTSWPLLKELLDDVTGIMMVDGEKAGIESMLRRNKSRKTEGDATSRRRIGRKLDLVARNFIRKEDWFIVESMRTWDQTSPKFLVEANVDLFREMHTIMVHRLQQAKNDEFQRSARFFGLYAGDRGFRTLEIRAAGARSYVAVCKVHQSYSLPSTLGNLILQFQSLTHILQIRACVVETMNTYEQTFEPDHDWLYSNDNITPEDETLASSPISP